MEINNILSGGDARRTEYGGVDIRVRRVGVPVC
jgi:hypothetical protein